jgi:HK97 family phage portal protein
MLSLLFGPPARRASGSWSDDGWRRGWSSRRTNAGVQVDEELALTYDAVWAATRVLCEPLGMLPLITYEREDDDGRRHATELPQYDLVKTSPNPEMGAAVFREGRVMHQVNWGNGFAEIERDGRGSPAAFWPIHPCRVRLAQPKEQAEGWYYRVRNDDNSDTLFRKEELLHVPGCLSEDGVWGKGVIAHARETIGFGIATERYGANFFGSGGQPRGIVYGPGMKDPEQRRNFRAEWKEIHGSPDSAEIAILPTEAKYEAMTLSNEDNQFLDTRKANKLSIATWYKVPPHMIGELSDAHFNNLEHQQISFVVHSLMPLGKKWEEQIDLKLLTREQRRRYYTEFNYAGLLKGDLLARMNAYQVGLTIGAYTINEVRRLENLPSIGPAGDKNYMPLNMTTAEAMAQSPPVPGEKTGIGSDQSGAPADLRAVALHSPEVKALKRWFGRALRRAERQQIKADLKQVEVEKKPTPPLPDPAAQRNAARAVLEQTLAWVFRKEGGAALRAAGGGDFDAWLADYYPRHRATLTEALAPACLLLATLGLPGDAAALAGRLCQESAEILRHSYDHETREQFWARVEAWPVERAKGAAAQILGEFPEEKR